MASIFLSYRRSDSVAWAKLLRDSLATNLPGVAVFRDIDTILPGDNFVEIITDAVSSCDVLIALIGPNWRNARNRATGKNRLFETDDFTRIEIATALKRKVRVIPVLVGGATMPVPDELPGDLQALCKRQNVELSDRNWDDACRNLAHVLARLLTPAGSTPPSPSDQISKGATSGGAAWSSDRSRRGMFVFVTILLLAAVIAITLVTISSRSG